MAGGFSIKISNLKLFEEFVLANLNLQKILNL